MALTREEIDAKYGKAPAKSGGSSAKPLVQISEPTAPVAATMKKLTPTAEPKALTREQIDAKYGAVKAAPIKEVVVTPVKEAPVQTQMKGVIPSTISQAPEKSLLGKIGGAVKSGLQKVGILKTEEEKVARSQNVTALHTALNDRQFLELGKSLGLDKTIKPTLPPEVRPDDKATIDFYTNKAIVDQVKSTMPQLKTDLGVQDPDQVDYEFVDKNFDQITKELGVRTQMTNKEFAGLALTLGLTAGTAGGISAGAAFVPTLVKLGVGLAGFEAMNAAERKINKFVTGNDESIVDTVSRKLDLGTTGETLLFLLDLGAKGKGLHSIGVKAPSVLEGFTKNTIVKYNLPKTTFIEPQKVKDIFQTGKKISAEEMDMVKSLGLDAKAYREAIQNGIKIEVPSEKITTIVDKPYWAKAKKIFGFEPTNIVVSDKAGGVKQAPAGYLPEKATPMESRIESTIPGITEKIAVSPKVSGALQSPVSPELIATIAKFTPQESAAFGNRIVQRINEEVGTKIDENSGIPSGIKVNEFGSPDGRPAQFNNQGKIEVFLPDLVKDLQSMAKGGEILAHPDTPKYSKVYKLEPGETMEQLAVRYTQDILIHEKSHEKTMSIADITTGRQLNQQLIQARAQGNEAAIRAAETAMDKHMESLEVKALEYERGNRAQLESDLFGKKGDSTDLQRNIDRALKGGKEEKVVISEKKLLKDKMKAQESASKAGKQAGLEEGKKQVSETKSRHNEIIEKIKDRQSSILQKKTSLINYAEAFLPVAERGKFLKAIRNTISDKEFIDTLTRMEKASDSANRKSLITDIQGELKGTIIKNKGGFPSVKFEKSAQDKLNTIRANVKGDYLNAQAKIADIVADHQTKNPNDTLPEDLIGEIQLLRMVGIKDMTAKELRGVLDDVKSIKETGRTLRELDLFNRETDIELKRGKIVDIITGGQKLPSDTQSIKQAEPDTFMKKIKDFDKNQRYGWEELMDVLSVKDKSTKQYESFLSKYATEKTNTSFNKQNEGEMKAIEPINTKIKEIYSLDKNSEVLALLNDLKEVKNLGTVTHADGVDRELKISRGQAIQMKMWQQDPTLEGSFTDGLKWGDQVWEKVDEMLKPEDVKMANYLVDEFYAEYYKTINPVFVKEFGTDLPFNEKYSPVHRDIDTTIPENVLLAKEMQNYATAKNNSLKNRVKNNVELKTTDAFENLQRHVNKMEHYKAWSETMYEFRRIFGNKEVRRAIKDFHGDTTLKITDNFLNDFARDGVSREKIVKGIDDIRTNATKALLGLNWKVGAKQLSGVLNYAIELPVKDFTTGVGSFWMSPLEKSRFLYNNSATLRERFGSGYERDIKTAINKGYDKSIAKTKDFGEMMFTLIRNADKFTVYQGAWASYRSGYMEGKKMGLSDADAKARGIRYAEDITNRVQESSRLDTLAPLQRGGSWAKLFTMFQSQPSKYLRIITNSIRNYKAGRGSKAQHLKRIAFAWFIVPHIYNMIAEQFVSEKYRSSPQMMLLKTALGPLSYPLIVGQMVQSVYGWAGGEKFGYTPSAAFSFMDDLQKSVKSISNGDAVEASTYLADTLGKLTGVPTTLVTKPVRNALKENKEEPKGAAAKF